MQYDFLTFKLWKMFVWNEKKFTDAYFQTEKSWWITSLSVIINDSWLIAPYLCVTNDIKNLLRVF